VTAGHWSTMTDDEARQALRTAIAVWNLLGLMMAGWR
jgi:hypothetical protein